MKLINLSTTLFCFIPKDKNINKVIIGTVKCGSRFLQTSDLFESVPFDINNLQKLKNVDKIYWIIREPHEHFISALMTELNSKINTTNNSYEINSKIKIKRNDEKFVYEAFVKLLKEISSEPFFVGKQTERFSHYYPIYKDLHNIIQEKYKIFYKTSFIHLSHLSSLISSVFNATIPYDENTYAFTKLKDKFDNDITPNWYTKHGIYELLNSDDCIKYWNNIKNIIGDDENAYNLLINFDFSEFLLKKIDELTIKIDEKLIDNNENYINIIETLTRLVNKTP
jgi:hypothetical protein